MSEISSKYNAGSASALIDVLCHELSQPLAVIMTLVELWQLGMAEPDDAATIQQQIDRLVLTMRELRAYSDAARFDSLHPTGENLLDLPVLAHGTSFGNLPVSWFA